MDYLTQAKQDLDTRVAEAEKAVAALKSARAALDGRDWKPKATKRRAVKKQDGLDPRTIGRVRSAIRKLPATEQGSTVAVAQAARLKEPTVERVLRHIEREAVTPAN